MNAIVATAPAGHGLAEGLPPSNVYVMAVCGSVAALIMVAIGIRHLVAGRVLEGAGVALLACLMVVLTVPPAVSAIL